jgi:signal transduction histidine kinase
MQEAGNGLLTAVLVDDDKDHLRLLEQALFRAFDHDPRKLRVQSFTRADQAIAELPATGEVVVLIDYRLGESTGIDWLPDFLRTDAGPVILMTSSGDEAIAADAFRQGASDYVVKSMIFENPGALRTCIRQALRRCRLEQSNFDLSRRLKLANAELERKNSRLAELTDTAHRFVDDVAHEFRTPLTVIKEFTSIILDGLGGEVSTKQSEYLIFIADASRDLAGLIDDFLDSGKLRARTLRVERREHTIGELMDASWPVLESRAASKNIRLERRIDPDLPPVFADAEKVRRTLVNLVVNAIKFSSRDGVVVVSASAPGPDRVVISVTDHGPGIPAEELEKLFERFTQVDGTEHINSKGFGLGLNIVKQLVALNLGEVGVTSKVGQGSVFSFSLPAAGCEHIIDAIVRAAAARSPESTLSVIRVSSASAATSLDDLRSFVASSSHPWDVQLPSSDDNAILVVGETVEPERWRERLLRAASARGDSGAVPPELFVEHVGAWPPAEATDALRQLAGKGKEIAHSA